MFASKPPVLFCEDGILFRFRSRGTRAHSTLSTQISRITPICSSRSAEFRCIERHLFKFFGTSVAPVSWFARRKNPRNLRNLREITCGSVALTHSKRAGIAGVTNTHFSAPVRGEITRMNKHELGRRSEAIACAYLTSRGWSVLERNYRAGHKEIDIIARLADTIAFVEVKARAGDQWGHPLEAITWAKRREVAFAAREWVRVHGSPGFEYRFDAIAVLWRGISHDVEHVPNAWSIQRR